MHARRSMRKLTAVLFLLLCSTSLIYGQKTRLGQKVPIINPADFTIKVHISATHIRYYCSHDKDVYPECQRLFADVTVNGKKSELSGSAKIVKKYDVLI